MRVSDIPNKKRGGGRPAGYARIPTCHPDRKHAARGLCRICYNAKLQEERMQNPKWVKRKRLQVKKWRENNRREINLRQRSQYLTKICAERGISVEQFHAMFEKLDGGCYICRAPMGGKICLDHDHRTGKARKLLCHNCNIGLGNFKDSILLLQEAARYLEVHSAEN